jgi:hypothetical protein
LFNIDTLKVNEIKFYNIDTHCVKVTRLGEKGTLEKIYCSSFVRKKEKKFYKIETHCVKVARLWQTGENIL